MGQTARPPRKRLMPRPWAAVATVTWFVALGVLLIGMFDLPRKQRAASMLVEHTLEVLDGVSALEALLEKAVIDARSFIFSGDTAPRARAAVEAGQLPDVITALRGLTAGNAAQQRTIDSVAAMIDERIAMLRQNMDLKAAGEDTALMDRVRTRAARLLSDRIAATLDTIRAEARRQLAERQREADDATWRAVAALVACGAVAGVSGFGALALLISRGRERGHLAELRRAEALLRAIMQTVPGHLYAKDLQGRLLAAGAAGLAFRGKSWSEIAGRTAREYLDDPVQAEATMAEDRRVMAEGKTQVREEQIEAADDGTVYTWLSTKTPMRDADGVVIGMVGMSLDITERKQAEDRLQAFNAALETSVQERTAELAASRERQQAYFNHSPIGMVVMRVRGDGDFVLEDLNPAARAAFGFPAQSERGSTYTELWPEMVARDKQRKMHDCVTQRTIIEYTVEREIRGEKRLLEIMLAPLLDDTSEARFVLICVHDVTTQRRLERQVMEQAERQAEAAEREMALFNNSPDELFVVRVDDGPDGPAFVYEAFSPALMTVTGLRPEDLIGYRPEQCLPPAVAQSILANYRRCLRERSTVKFTETRDLEIGKRDVEGWVTPVLHPATGRVVRLVGDVRDVTERNRMEAAFRQGQKMEAIGLLAAGVAHDFNNILQAVISGLDMVIEETRPGTPAHDIAGVALGSAMRGSQLTHHLLSYARKQMLWPQTINLAAFLPEIERLMARTLGPHIAIDLRVEPGTHARADPGELETALLNIAFNAAHAMAKGGTLSIDARSDDTDGKVWA